MTGYSVPSCGLSWWLLKIHKFFRYIYVSYYYYLTPFLILVFQTLLLYSNEIYKQYLKNKAESDAVEAAAVDTSGSGSPG